MERWFLKGVLCVYLCCIIAATSVAAPADDLSQIHSHLLALQAVAPAAPKRSAEEEEDKKEVMAKMGAYKASVVRKVKLLNQTSFPKNEERNLFAILDRLVKKYAEDQKSLKLWQEEGDEEAAQMVTYMNGQFVQDKEKIMEKIGEIKSAINAVLDSFSDELKKTRGAEVRSRLNKLASLIKAYQNQRARLGPPFTYVPSELAISNMRDKVDEIFTAAGDEHPQKTPFLKKAIEEVYQGKEVEGADYL